MKLRRSLVLMAGAAALSACAFADEGLPTQKVLTLGVAQTIAEEAIARCRADGYKISVVVVDITNVLKAVLRDDGADLVTIQAARMKANSVMNYGRASGPPPSTPAGAPAPLAAIPGILNSRGGLPIKVNNQLIGAVSVSGAPGDEKNVACADAALAKVADKLK